MKTKLLALAALLCITSTAHAIPTLQLYMEGATYDISTESWTLATPGVFTLWVLGSNGPIYDVKLAAAYASGETGSVTIAGTTAKTPYIPSASYDTTTPTDPTFIKTVTDGSKPIMGDGGELASHGTYGSGVNWSEWLLGDFISTADKTADMTASSLNWKDGQLNAYTVTIEGFTSVQFDAYDHVVQNSGKNKYVFSPFSHDAETNPPIPEPGTFALLGVGLVGLAAWRRKQSRN